MTGGVSTLQWALIGAVWLACAFGGGAALAWLWKRRHPALSFHKLWALWTVVLSLAVALLLALGRR